MRRGSCSETVRSHRTHIAMTRALAEEVKRRAFRELRQRDEEGSFLELNYRQKQAFKEEDVGLVRPILDQRLKRTKRML